MTRARREQVLRCSALATVFSLLIYFGMQLRERRLETRRTALLPKFENESCRQTYFRFFREPSVEMRVVFGYKDARPARFVADRYERLLFVQRILAPCPTSRLERACGFRRDMNDADLFTREIHGPDGEPRTVRLRVVQPSVGADDEENRKDPFQAWRTVYAQKEFLGGLAVADLVLYNGHSRAGGGPDFRPPRITASQEIDFGWYQAHEPGFEPVLKALRALPAEVDRPKLVGFLSCASSTHFLARVNEIRPTLGTVTSPRLLYFSDALESSLETLSSILSFRCQKDFERSLKKAETRASGARVSGFFKSI